MQTDLHQYMGRLWSLTPESTAKLLDSLEPRAHALDEHLHTLEERLRAAGEAASTKLTTLEADLIKLRVRAVDLSHSGTTALSRDKAALSMEFADQLLDTMSRLGVEVVKGQLVLAEDIASVVQPSLTGLEERMRLGTPTPAQQQSTLAGLVLAGLGLIPVLGSVATLVDVARTMRGYLDRASRLGEAVQHVRQLVAYDWLLTVMEEDGMTHVVRLVEKREQEFAALQPVLEACERGLATVRRALGAEDA